MAKPRNHPAIFRPPLLKAGRFSAMLLICVHCLGGAYCIAQAPKAPEEKLNEIYAAAMGAFARGDFQKAVEGLDQMLTLGASGPGLESVHFSIAAAHYNLKEYEKAKTKFEAYKKLYPNGSKVGDAQMAIAQCQLALGDKAGAAASFESVSTGGQNEQVLLMRASLLKEAGKPDEAMALLEPVFQKGLKSAAFPDAAMLIASTEVARGNRDRSWKILASLHGRPDLIEDPLQLNALTFELGDSFFEAKEYRNALKAYGLVRQRDELLAAGRARLVAISKKVDVNVAIAKGDPSRVVELIALNNRLKAMFEEGKQALDGIEKAPSTTGALRMRQARCFQEIGRLWEAVVLFEYLRQEGETEVRESALYSLAVFHAELGNTNEALDAIAAFEKEFPKSAQLQTAIFVQGTQLLLKGESGAAVGVFTKLLKMAPSGQHSEAAQFLSANALFSEGKYDEALGAYQAYAKKHAKGENIEEVVYRIALCHFFSGDYAKAHPALESYLDKYDDGFFSADAAYRVASCYQAAKRYDDVVKKCEAWEVKNASNALLGDVLALKGDALVAKDRRDEAVLAYRKAVENTPNDEVVSYALFEANKQLQRLGKWDKSAEMFREFLAARPSHPAAVSAMYWLSRAMVKEGKLQEAKEYLAEQISKFIGDRSRDAVEQLITLLAQFCSKRPESQTVDAGGTPPVYDAVGELKKYLDADKNPAGALSKARMMFAEAELMRFLRKPEIAVEKLDVICEQTPPLELGAYLLAQCGDRLLERGKRKEAADFYEALAKEFPKSELLDYSYNGLGQIALLNGKAEDAIKFFEMAIDKAGATSKLRDVTHGRAKALLLLGKLDEAKTVFEQVASTREWRGECTAEAVFSLGEVAFAKGDFTTAVQYFQRVFVAYQRYATVVAKAYLRAADCFEKLGEPEKAVAHLREMVSKEKLAALPEVRTAKKRMGVEAVK
jgi:TolA-binding protein